MKSQSIGIIDSGLGGYTIYEALRDAFPEVSFTFIADQRNSPFGSKTHEELKAIGIYLIEELVSRDIYDVIVACNTISSTVLDELETLYPDVNFYGVIQMTAESLRPKHKTVVILATEATIQSHAYQKVILEKNPTAWVDEVAAPELVNLIEGLAYDEDIDEYVGELLMTRNKVDALIMGCTHFPIVSENIGKFTDAQLITSIEPMIHLIDSLEDKPIGQSRVYTTYDPFRLQHQIKTLFNRDEVVEKIELEQV